MPQTRSFERRTMKNRNKTSNRRTFLRKLNALSIGAFAVSPTQLVLADQFSDDRRLPNVSHGVSIGDISADKAVIWSRADRPSQMIVEVSSDATFKQSRKIIGPEVLEHSDFTGKVILQELFDADYLHYRVSFRDLDQRKKVGAAVTGRARLLRQQSQDITFAWSGDTAGQGFGIDEARGGMQTYQAMQKMEPDFFVHSGDVCYADGPFASEIKMDDGSTWKNIVTESTRKVAETLGEFRANFRYNLLDKHVRNFNSTVPVFAQWDDHETVNNWFPGEQLTNDDRYTIKSVSLLAARARQAFFDYMPIRPSASRQIYRKIARGSLLELFFLDLRSYKGPNTKNNQAAQSATSNYFGGSQLSWLKQQLKSCRSTWKFICSDMPIGLIVADGENFENNANGDGPPLGRELEVAELLRFIKEQEIKNVVFITADVHYAASHYYDPNAATFTDFKPFWEFVSGPLHAGTFGPNKLDNTFGPQVKFCSVSETMKPNRPPSAGLQFFGFVEIDSQTKVATVSHYNRNGEKLWQTDLQPE